MTTYTRDEIELLAAYEAEQIAIRQQMVSGIYHNAVKMLQRWQQFNAEFQQSGEAIDPETGETVITPGGRFAALAAQYAADSAIGITVEEIATMAGALTVIVGTMRAIEARTPGMFGI